MTLPLHPTPELRDRLALVDTEPPLATRGDPTLPLCTVPRGASQGDTVPLGTLPRGASQGDTIPLGTTPRRASRDDATVPMRTPPRPPPRLRFPALSAASRPYYTAAVALLTGAFLASLGALPALLPAHRLARGLEPHTATGVAAALLLGSNFLVALRRHRVLGASPGSSYPLWVGVHLLSTLAALALLVVHVAGRRGLGVAFLVALAVMGAVLSGMPGLVLWQRALHSSLARIVKRRWLRFHVLTMGLLVVALLLHVLQVLYF